MNTRIVNTGKRAARIQDVSARPKRLDGASVAASLGGRSTGVHLGRDNSPITLFQVRGELDRLLFSDGGRPSLAGMQDKVKIPRFAQDWDRIEALAEAAAQGMTFRPSPGHVAAVLLHEALERFSDDESKQFVRRRMVA